MGFGPRQFGAGLELIDSYHSIISQHSDGTETQSDDPDRHDAFVFMDPRADSMRGVMGRESTVIVTPSSPNALTLPLTKRSLSSFRDTRRSSKSSASTASCLPRVETLVRPLHLPSFSPTSSIPTDVPGSSRSWVQGRCSPSPSPHRSREVIIWSETLIIQKY